MNRQRHNWGLRCLEGDFSQAQCTRLSGPAVRALIIFVSLATFLLPNTFVSAITDNPPTITSPTIFSLQNATPKVDGASGALTQSIPLDTPPGRNGLQPDLSLNYNSQDTDQDSIVGYGWTLSIPYIERLNKTGSENFYGPNAYFTSSLDGELADSTTTAAASSTLTDGLSAYWNFDQSSGNALDSSGNGNTLQLGGSPSYVSGKIKNAIALSSASSQYLDITNASQTGLGFSGSFTIAAWIKFNSLPST